MIGPIGNKNHQAPINIVKNPKISIIQFGINDILDIAKHKGFIIPLGCKKASLYLFLIKK
ncbi:hypothetical protein EB001_18275 [bacterium]|nr:hypothetical protein [bacterium]